MVENTADLFDALYNGNLCAIMFSDIQGHLTQANGYCTRLLGYSEKELNGKRAIELAPEEDRAYLLDIVRGLAEGEKTSVNLTHRFIRKDGELVWITGSLSTFINTDGTEMMESAFIDITAEKEAESRRDSSLEVISSMANKYDSFYLCDVEDDSFRRIGENKRRKEIVDIPTEGVFSEAVTRFTKEGVSPEFRPIFEKFLSPEYIRSELAGSRNSLEFQYRESKALKSRWKLGEIIAVTRDEEDYVARYCFMVTDINDLKRREFERLRQREAQAAIVDIAYEMTGIFDFTYQIPERSITLPERTYRALGCKPRYDDMPGEFRDTFIHPDYYDVFNEMYARCNAGEDKTSSEFKDVRGVHWYRTTLHIIERDDDDQPRLALGIVERVDELHAARSEAATMQQLCQFAVESHYEDLVFIDTNDHSYAFADLGGGVAADWNGINTQGDFNDATRRLIDEVAADDAGREELAKLYLDDLVPALKRDGKLSVRYRAKLDGGEVRWKLIECAFFNNEFDKILMLISDVQREEAYKEELREARAAADEANRAKSAFLANMSHEIRTPMNTIIGISEILLNRQLPLEILNEISTIQNAASGLLAIINDILDFSKIESGKFVVTPVDYMLPSLLMDINNMISVRLVDKPVDFLINIDHRLPNHLIGDDIRIEQILMNLLGNAVKFTKEGFIELRIGGEAINETDYKLTCKVIDSGIGIKQEDLDKLFGSFSQVDTTKNRSITGSGLGLAISRSFAEMMGGGITVDSVYGKGTTFTVELMQQVKYYEPIGEVRPKDVRMLICENNEVIISSVSRTLENLGVEFRVCRELDKVRTFPNMTHVIIRRSNFLTIREKIDFMFDCSNIYLILENGEQASGDFMEYKQLQLPLLCMQIINALNGETIANSYKRKNFDRSQIIPLSYAHVLIVDDNVTNLQVARGLMAPYQMQVDVATSGFKAIELAKSIKYDIIFMDHMMPEMDGLETTKHIRELPGAYYRNLPIVALTANAVSDARELFLSNGLDDFLAKPIEMTELHRILKKYVQSKAPAGYMEEYLKHNTDHVAKTQQPRTAAKSGALPIASPIAPANLQVSSANGRARGQLPAVDGGALSQLLAQNNVLLSQNMLLLQSLLGAAPAEGVDVQGGTVAATPALKSDMPMAENAGLGPDQSTEVLPGSIPEVNMTKTLETYGGSVKVYHGILETYFHDISEREPALRTLFANKDIENLTISVHAIKSASREIGADALGELAFQLEKAGKDNDWPFIEEQFETFMDELDSMRTNVGAYVKEFIMIDGDPTEREMRDAFPEETVVELKEACDNMDYTLVEEKLEELDGFRYPEALSATLSAMIRFCAEFEYDKLDKAVRTL